MPILDSSNSAANKDTMSKKNGQLLIQLSDWVENIVGKKEKLLIMNNFSLSHKVFKRCLLLMHQNEYLWSKGLKSILYNNQLNPDVDWSFAMQRI